MYQSEDQTKKKKSFEYYANFLKEVQNMADWTLADRVSHYLDNWEVVQVVQ